MIEQKVIVTEVTDDYLVLDPVAAGCNSCQQGSCGVASLASLFGKRSRSLRIVNPGGFSLHEELELLIDEALFLRTVFVQYLLPLAVVFIVIFMAEIFNQSIGIQVMIGSLGLFGGIFLSRFLIRWMETHLFEGMFRIRKLEAISDHREFNIQISIS